jgi:hypothetical protein
VRGLRSTVRRCAVELTKLLRKVIVMSDLREHAQKTNVYWLERAGKGHKPRLARNRRRAEPRIIMDELWDYDWNPWETHDYDPRDSYDVVGTIEERYVRAVEALRAIVALRHTEECRRSNAPECVCGWRLAREALREIGE